VSRLRRLFAVLLAASLASGCSTWQAVRQPPAVAAAVQKQPMHVRVTTLDGREIEMKGAEIVGDSLIGKTARPTRVAWDATVADAPKGPPGGTRVAVALADVRSLAAKQVDTWSTLVGLGILIGFITVGALLWDPFVD
jgi:hypothetical protein